MAAALCGAVSCSDKISTETPEGAGYITVTSQVGAQTKAGYETKTLPADFVMEVNQGAAAEYDFSIVISVPANTSTGELTRQIVVTDGEGHTDTCLLTQAAGDAMLVVSKTAIELAYTGEAVSFDITSNTSWVIK